MNSIINNFIKGYIKSIELIPNFNSNNQNSDWINISIDIQNSIKKYESKQNGKQTFIKQRRK